VSGATNKLEKIETVKGTFPMRSVLSYIANTIGKYIVRRPQLKREWPRGSQSRQTVKYDHESHGIRNYESLCWRQPAAIGEFTEQEKAKPAIGDLKLRGGQAYDSSSD
jgi:hypothetical protein